MTKDPEGPFDSESKGVTTYITPRPVELLSVTIGGREREEWRDREERRVKGLFEDRLRNRGPDGVPVGYVFVAPSRTRI